ncbi:MAG: MiaB/RimO family radical SAM methylthiotransferase [bacterium]|uniref:tRNA-2-methylthio-N(6)-dimethylallyladenosine synthase n=2 Tax=Bacteria candidate phyla TaxID=1783234 RepID=A0A101I1V9_UNCT6|nr:MAG: (Dimethylallyl)adenosine tRNA methylthiotransferase MiaB [candidate division TA06 bacterium 32_111]KUK86698.1 MAG: (Dimethylallyl)adenosine tRNA methylthiotransferase MiaB [candidate division TA06 bacterium 34_109]MDI6700198.1 MiaB/RimO family radical SAM methylthiotransferase [bacterium]HAF08452.1 tRNA (N6-isopentenyl adenosine(37)-C2)-methylthiotransferase MiaB [candidate division WOR-3 bacterium]HCP17412.1 tRNA (N6-isopentenyl adenosine(37)-C2)-methylthiotransferase MiaB [candidate d
MKRETFKIVTYGCEMNDYDSEVITSILKSDGYEEVFDIEDAKIVVVNGCSVRDHAEKRALGFIQSLKGKKDGKRFIIAGCLAKSLENENIFLDESFIVSTEYKKLPELLKQNNFKKFEISSEGNYSDILRNTDFTLNIPIMKGCNNFCSYCTVPYLRGEEVSFSVDDIIENIKRNINEKTGEIMLLGQNVNSYSYDSYDFVRVLERVAKEFKELRVRFLTSHPKDFSPDIVKLMAEYENLCPHLHLPVQTGSDKLLKLLHRDYTVKDYLEKVEISRKIVEDISITTDIMVGLPYEGEEDFKETLKLVMDIQFDDAFMYKFSKRKNTLAYYMDGCDKKVSSSRLKKLIDLQRSVKEKKLKELVGREVEVIVEKVSKKSKNEFYGRDRHNRSVVVNGENITIKDKVIVRIVKIKGITPYGIKKR